MEASWSTEQVPGQPGMYPQTTLSGVGRRTPKKQTKPLYIAECGGACLYSQPSGGRDKRIALISWSTWSTLWVPEPVRSTLCFKKERTDGMWSYVNSEFIYIWGCICLSVSLFQLKGLPLPSPECRDQRYAPPLLAVFISEKTWKKKALFKKPQPHSQAKGSLAGSLRVNP